MPSMYYQNNCSAEELIEFADRLNNAVQTNSVISFSTKEKENIRDFGPAFIIYLTKYKKLNENTSQELIKLVNVYIKPFFYQKGTNRIYLLCSNIFISCGK